MKSTIVFFRLALLLCLPFGAFAQTGVNFDGSNDWISTNQVGITSNASRTMECWIKVPTTAPATQMVIIDMGTTAANGNRFTLNILSNKLRLEIAGSGFNGVTNVCDGQWHHVAATYNPSNATNTKGKIYLDGVLESQADFTVTVATASGNIRMGTRVDGINFFSGSMDEVRVWNVERTASQISSSKSTQFCTPPTGLIAFYKFNDGTASGTNTSITSLANWANSSYSGTLTNFGRTGSSSNFVTGAPVTEVGPTASAISPTACMTYTSPKNRIYNVTGTYKDTLTNSVGCDSVITINLTIKAPPAAPAYVIGNTSVCPGSAQTYSVNAVAGATSYVWTLPSGWTGTSTSNTIALAPDTSGGIVSVVAVNSCGTSSASGIAVAITSQLPAQPAAMFGSSNVCDSSSQTYMVPAVPNALTYNWTLPSGWSGTSTSNTIIVTAGKSGGTISVNADNGCGVSPARSFNVNVSPRVVPSAAITSSSNTVCAGAIATFSAAAINGGSTPGLQWSVNGSPVGTGTNTFSSSSLKNGDVVSLTLTSTAACPTPNVVASNSIKMTVNPISVPGINVNASTSPSICSGTAVTFSTNIVAGGPTPAYQWMLNGAPVGTNSSIYTAPGLNDKDAVYCILTSNAACSIPLTANSNKIAFQVTPVIVPDATVSASPGNIVIPGQTVTFTATFTGGGVDPDFQWLKNGVEIPGEIGDTYTSNGLKHSDEISVRMFSSELCAVPAYVTSTPVKMKIQAAGIAGKTKASVEFALAPNPNNGQFEINLSSPGLDRTESLMITVTDVVGQKVYQVQRSMPAMGQKILLSMPENSNSGIYFVQLQTASWSMAEKMEVRR